LNRPPKKRYVVLLAAIAILLIIAIALLYEYHENPPNYATVYIGVTNSHDSENLTITIFVDGKEIETDDLSAGATCKYVYWPRFSGSETTIKIMVVGSGSGTDYMVPTSPMTVQSGSVSEINLTI